MDLINGLYEDVELRLKRWASTQEYKEKFEIFLKDGAKLKLLDNTVYIYGCGLVVVDNRQEPALCYFTLLPIFDTASTTPKVPYIISYPVDWLTLQKQSIDLSIGSNKIVLSNNLTISEAETIETFKLKIKTDMDFKVQESMLFFDAENTIRESIRNSETSE